MDILIICRDALENSVIGSIGLALAANKEGQVVGILFTQEALAAIAGKSFHWSPLFENREARIKISRNATAMGIEVSSNKDNRWTDIPRLLKKARKEGIKLLACPIWTRILGVAGKFPAEITEIDTAAMLKALGKAKIVIGGL